MDNRLINDAKEIINKIHYITLATVTPDGLPWSTPVFSAFDTQYTFYWRSAKNAIHSLNIKDNGKIFISIYDTTTPWGIGNGVYIKATAFELIDKKDIQSALAILDKRSLKTVGTAQSFMNDNQRRIYKAVPKKVWINSDEEINGIFIDKRVEIQLM